MCDGIVINGNVICAICNKTVEQTMWSFHKLKHNNLAWRVGDRPLDLKDELIELQILNALYKAKKPLYCAICSTVKKSVLGLLSHQMQCGNKESAKVACEICKKKLLPASLPIHIKMVHETPKITPFKSNYFDVEEEAPQVKRKAAANALVKMDKILTDTSEIFKHYTKQINFESSKTLISCLNKELEDNKSIKCKIKLCDFCSEDVASLLVHMATCSLKPDQYYTCNKCFFVGPSEREMIKHLKTTHDLRMKDDDFIYEEESCSEEDEMNDEERDVEINVKKEKRRKSNRTLTSENVKAKPLFILETSGARPKASHRILYSHAFRYALDFCGKNFQHNTLFENFKCEESQWSLLEESCLEKYLPPSELSCDVIRKNVEGFQNVQGDDYTFKRFELFETEQGDDYITVYCGGPVLSLAWLPTPYTSFNQPQMLAVATGKDFDGKYKINEFYNESTLIQFWNFGLLKNGEKFSAPKLDFCLAVDNSPIWQMEWCPSGCYNANESTEWPRIGLLAVAGCTMSVDIYSIPLMKEERSGLIYKTKPALKLQLIIDDNNLKRKIFPTKISWSKVSGHSYIAVGYTDGTLALYNLNMTVLSNLLHFKDETSTEVMLPYKILKAHSHFISVLSLIPIDEGNRWLLSASVDRGLYVWDLYSDEKVSTKKNRVIVDGAWPTYWLCHITTSEEASPVQGNLSATVLHHREYLHHDNLSLSISTSTMCSLSASDWLNGFLHCNTVGEVMAFFPHQMLYDMGKLRKYNNFHYLKGYTILIDKTISPEMRVDIEKKKLATKEVPSTLPESEERKQTDDKKYQPMHYKEAIRQYGVVFCDTITPISCSQAGTEYSKPNLYPLQMINKICYNPNRQASLYYASGYQIGFVRVSYLKFLENDKQITDSQADDV